MIWRSSSEFPIGSPAFGWSAGYSNHHSGVWSVCHRKVWPHTRMSFASAYSTSWSASAQVNSPSTGWIASGFMWFSALMELKCLFSSSP